MTSANFTTPGTTPRSRALWTLLFGVLGRAEWISYVGAGGVLSQGFPGHWSRDYGSKPNLVPLLG